LLWECPRGQAYYACIIPQSVNGFIQTKNYSEKPSGLDLQKFLVTHSDSLIVISPEELKDKVIGLLKDGGKVYGVNR
jgi:hypothetical protein